MGSKLLFHCYALLRPKISGLYSKGPLAAMNKV